MAHIKRKIVLIILIIFNICMIGGIWHPFTGKMLDISYDICVDHVDQFTIYYEQDGEWIEGNSDNNVYANVNEVQQMRFQIQDATTSVKMELGKAPGKIQIKNIVLSKGIVNVKLNSNKLEQVNVKEIVSGQDDVQYETEDNAYFLVRGDVIGQIDAKAKTADSIVKICVAVIAALALLVCYKNIDYVVEIVRIAWGNRKLIKSLVVSDFRAKYAGNQFGVFWAFVQPGITSLIYIFVFQVIGRAAPIQTNVPYSLWLLPGIVPWFYFSESIMSATNSLSEYSYLVKKVLFNIEILPIVKVFSAFIVHLFLTGFVLIIYVFAGMPLRLSMIQIIYYMICNTMLSIAISYLTSALVPFFKDMSQILNVVLMIGMWCCPIMWDLNLLPAKYHFLIKMNPVYYIVQGFRKSYMGTGYFYEDIITTVYFWMIVIVAFCLNAGIFCRLKRHFADVL